MFENIKHRPEDPALHSKISFISACRKFCPFDICNGNLNFMYQLIDCNLFYKRFQIIQNYSNILYPIPYPIKHSRGIADGNPVYLLLLIVGQEVRIQWLIYYGHNTCLSRLSSLWFVFVIPMAEENGCCWCILCSWFKLSFIGMCWNCVEGNMNP